MRQFLTTIGVLACAAAPAAAATVGHTDDFNSGLGGWASGAMFEIVPSGGVGGVGDGYLRASRDIPAQLGVRADAPEFNGNLTADGVTGYSFWLSDLGTNDNLEIHVGVGTAFANFWQYNGSFAAPTDGWAFHTIDFSDPSNWTQIIGTGTFADALAASNRLLFRHDNAPYDQQPPLVTGDFGLDRVTVVPEPGSLLLVAGGLLLLRRR